jgi:prepilin peptidase CpaA
MTFMTYAEIPAAAVLLVGAIACVFDLRTRRIPNALTFGAAVVALGFHLWVGGLPALGASLGGLAVGLAIFFPIFALGGIGAGDVKLLACMGAWLGPMAALWTAMYAAMAGGVMALVVVLVRGYVRQAFRNVWLLLVHWRVAGIRPLPELTLKHGKGPRLAYALAITAGVVVTICLR